MAIKYYNTSGELTQSLVSSSSSDDGGDNLIVKSISLVNVHASTTCTVDLYIEKKLTGKFYLAKAVSLPVGVTLVFDSLDIKAGIGNFDLYIKLTKGASEVPVVDVIIS